MLVTLAEKWQNGIQNSSGGGRGGNGCNCMMIVVAVAVKMFKRQLYKWSRRWYP